MGITRERVFVTNQGPTGRTGGGTPRRVGNDADDDRGALINALAANARCPFDAAALCGMPIRTLQRLGATFALKAGDGDDASVEVNASGDGDEYMLPMPLPKGWTPQSDLVPGIHVNIDGGDDDYVMGMPGHKAFARPTTSTEPPAGDGDEYMLPMPTWPNI